MTWLSRISISCVAAPLIAATVSGRIQLSDSREASVRKKMEYSGVVVSLEPLSRSSLPALPAARARMAQKDKMFIPHVLAVAAGTVIEFPNFDPIFHNAFSNYDGQIFDIGLYPPGSTRSVRFSRPGAVRVFCNIHSEMSAVIVVLSTPWFATTGTNGAYEIRGVPPGEYSLRVFHERATPATLEAASRIITIAAEPVVMPPIDISESGYLPIPHKNKYGHEYPPPPSDGIFYPSVRK